MPQDYTGCGITLGQIWQVWSSSGGMMYIALGCAGAMLREVIALVVLLLADGRRSRPHLAQS